MGIQKDILARLNSLTLTFDTGHEDNAKLLAESELIAYQCEARNTFPILFKEPLKIKAQRWYVLVLFRITELFDCLSCI